MLKVLNIKDKLSEIDNSIFYPVYLRTIERNDSGIESFGVSSSNGETKRFSNIGSSKINISIYGPTVATDLDILYLEPG